MPPSSAWRASAAISDHVPPPPSPGAWGRASPTFIVTATGYRLEAGSGLHIASRFPDNGGGRRRIAMFRSEPPDADPAAAFMRIGSETRPAGMCNGAGHIVIY